MDNREITLGVEELNASSYSDKKVVKIVKDVSFQLKKGKALVAVGESDCGRSITMNSIMRFTGKNTIMEAKSIQYNVLRDGEIKEYHLESIKEPNGPEMRSPRRPDMSMVFQNPMSSLNPVHKVGDQMTEGLLQHNKGMTRQQTREKILEIFKKLGIPDPEERIDYFPHQFSDGMEQGVVIAIAMICNPELIICDKPTTAPDVTIQAQIMELLKEPQVKNGKSIILITHNVGLVAKMTSEVCVMYMGRVVEFGSLEDAFGRTSHPCTKALLHSAPVLGSVDGQKLETIPGVTPNPFDLKEGYEFADRCPECTENCRKGVIPTYEVGPSHHMHYLKYRSCPEVGQINENREVVFKVENLQTWFPITKGMLRKAVGHVRVVDNANLEVYKGETLGIVGESGCRKSAFGKTVMMLERPTGGRVLFSFGDEFRDITQFNKEEMFNFRRKVQVVFQDLYSALNPQKKMYSSFKEPLKVHDIDMLKKREEVMQKVLKMVDIQPDCLMRYPHELSGGQWQELCIARALEVMPEVLICNEPVSTLDVSIRAQVLNMMKEIQEEMKLAYLFIAHDLSVIQYMSGRTMVMYLGHIVEAADSRALYDEPLHPYTQALLLTTPVADIHKMKKRQVLEGEVPSPIHKLDGYPFHNRCPKCIEVRKTQPPAMAHRGAEGHMVACHLYDGERK